VAGRDPGAPVGEPLWRQRLSRLLAGFILTGEHDRALRPVLIVYFLGATAFSAFWSFVAVWAIDELHASSTQIGVMFFFDAVAGAAAGFVGGNLSDRLGRRPVIVFGWLAQSLVVLALAAAGDAVVLGLALVVAASAAGAPALAAGSAIVADLVPEEARESAYAAQRVVFNLGVVLGPPVGAVLLLVADWASLRIGVAALGFVAAIVAWRQLPVTGAHRADEAHPTRTRAIRVIARDLAFLLLLASTLLGFVVYIAFETVLPVVAVSSFDLEPSTWGFLVIINPLLVTLFQLRLTNRVAAVSPARKLAAAMLLMGFPFLLLLLSGSIAVVVVVIVIFVAGEMLWTPTAQALAAALAPDRFRGAYMGAFGSSSAIAWALGPLAALQVRDAYGDGALWGFFAAISLAAAIVGIAASRAGSVESAPRAPTLPA
jgi:predicted MFS family arabinose efflux permease